MKKKIEPAIGDVVEIDGMKYVCKAQSESKYCGHCAFYEMNCAHIICCGHFRKDGTDVYFGLVTGENAEQEANAIKEEKHKIGTAVLSTIREEVVTKAAAEVEKSRNNIEEENQSILNYLRDFLLRHNSRITEVKVAPEPLYLGLGKLVEVPADRIIIALKQGTQE